MLEIKILGRGGQGAVTTGYLLAIAAFHDGKFSQSFPNFGVERTGAPVEAFCRIDRQKINIRSQIYEPDVIIVLDPSLIHAEDVTKGLKKNGTIIINTNKKKEELGIKEKFNLHTIDATGIALKIFGKPIVNTAMLGAFSATTKEVSLLSLQKAVDEVFLKKKGEKISELNKKVIDEVYRSIQ